MRPIAATGLTCPAAGVEAMRILMESCHSIRRQGAVRPKRENRGGTPLRIDVGPARNAYICNTPEESARYRADDRPACVGLIFSRMMLCYEPS
jgi:hypothetical protein